MRSGDARSAGAQHLPFVPSSPRAGGFIAGIWNKFFSRYGLFGRKRALLDGLCPSRGAGNQLPDVPSLPSQQSAIPLRIKRADRCSLSHKLLDYCSEPEVLQTHAALERVVTLTFDALISFGIMIVITLIVFLPYVRGFDFEIEGFKNPDFLYDPVAVAGMALENRLLFASGLFDFERN